MKSLLVSLIRGPSVKSGDFLSICSLQPLKANPAWAGDTHSFLQKMKLGHFSF